MPSAFAATARAFLQPAYALHAQGFEWTPMREAADVNAPAEPDPMRRPALVSGVFFDKLARRDMQRVYDPRADQRPGDTADMPRVEFPPPPAAAPPDVRRLDLLADENGVVWRVFATFVKKSGVLVAQVTLVS